MLVSEMLTRAGVIAGLNDFTGASIDQNYAPMALAFMKQAISDINNDTQLATKTLLFDFLKEILPQDMEAWEKGGRADPPPSPQILGMEYILPKGTRRVLRAFSGSSELRKTDFSTVAKSRLGHGSLDFFAINDGKIHISQPLPLAITYVPEIPDYGIADYLDVEPEYEPYIANQVAYCMALAFSTNTVETCRLLAEQSYNLLMANKRVQTGNIYLNSHASLNRFG